MIARTFPTYALLMSSNASTQVYDSSLLQGGYSDPFFLSPSLAGLSSSSGYGNTRLSILLAFFVVDVFLLLVFAFGFAPTFLRGLDFFSGELWVSGSATLELPPRHHEHDPRYDHGASAKGFKAQRKGSVWGGTLFLCGLVAGFGLLGDILAYYSDPASLLNDYSTYPAPTPWLFAGVSAPLVVTLTTVSLTASQIPCFQQPTPRLNGPLGVSSTNVFALSSTPTTSGALPGCTYTFSAPSLTPFWALHAESGGVGLLGDAMATHLTALSRAATQGSLAESVVGSLGSVGVPTNPGPQPSGGYGASAMVDFTLPLGYALVGWSLSLGDTSRGGEGVASIFKVPTIPPPSLANFLGGTYTTTPARSHSLRLRLHPSELSNGIFSEVSTSGPGVARGWRGAALGYSVWSPPAPTTLAPLFTESLQVFIDSSVGGTVSLLTRTPRYTSLIVATLVAAAMAGALLAAKVVHDVGEAWCGMRGRAGCLCACFGPEGGEGGGEGGGGLVPLGSSRSLRGLTFPARQPTFSQVVAGGGLGSSDTTISPVHAAASTGRFYLEGIAEGEEGGGLGMGEGEDDESGGGGRDSMMDEEAGGETGMVVGEHPSPTHHRRHHHLEVGGAGGVGPMGGNGGGGKDELERYLTLPSEAQRASMRRLDVLAGVGAAPPPLPTHATPRSRLQAAGKKVTMMVEMSFYAPKAVPASMESLIKCCIEGDVEGAKRSWKPSTRSLALSFTREDTCHPLLHAVHRLHVGVVRLLLDEGLSPRQRGTVHPYTGDCFMVSDLQGISPLELVTKMAFLFPRKSKRREAILEVQALLMERDARLKSEGDALRAKMGSGSGSGGEASFTPFVHSATSQQEESSSSRGIGEATTLSTITPGYPLANPGQPTTSPLVNTDPVGSPSSAPPALPFTSPIPPPDLGAAAEGGEGIAEHQGVAGGKTVAFSEGDKQPLAVQQQQQLPTVVAAAAAAAAGAVAPFSFTGGKRPRGGRGNKLETLLEGSVPTVGAGGKRRGGAVPSPPLPPSSLDENMSVGGEEGGEGGVDPVDALTWLANTPHLLGTGVGGVAVAIPPTTTAACDAVPLYPLGSPASQAFLDAVAAMEKAVPRFLTATNPAYVPVPQQQQQQQQRQQQGGSSNSSSLPGEEGGGEEEEEEEEEGVAGVAKALPFTPSLSQVEESGSMEPVTPTPTPTPAPEAAASSSPPTFNFMAAGGDTAGSWASVATGLYHHQGEGGGEESGGPCVFNPPALPPLLPLHRVRAASSPSTPPSLLLVGFPATTLSPPPVVTTLGNRGSSQAPLCIHRFRNANEVLEWGRGCEQRGGLLGFKGFAPFSPLLHPTPATLLLAHSPTTALPSTGVFLGASALCLTAVAAGSAGGVSSRGGGVEAARARASSAVTAALQTGVALFTPLVTLLKTLVGGALLPHTHTSTLLLLVPRAKMGKGVLAGYTTGLLKSGVGGVGAGAGAGAASSASSASSASASSASPATKESVGEALEGEAEGAWLACAGLAIACAGRGGRVGGGGGGAGGGGGYTPLTSAAGDVFTATLNGGGVLTGKREGVLNSEYIALCITLSLKEAVGANKGVIATGMEGL